MRDVPSSLPSQPGQAATDKDAERLERRFDRLEKELPESASGLVRWLREPSLRWVRIPLGIILIIGGLLSILPVLGIWMVPLGALVLAQDVPFLKRPVGRAMVWLERQWLKWRRRWQRG